MRDCLQGVVLVSFFVVFAGCKSAEDATVSTQSDAFPHADMAVTPEASTEVVTQQAEGQEGRIDCATLELCELANMNFCEERSGRCELKSSLDYESLSAPTASSVSDYLPKGWTIPAKVPGDLRAQYLQQLFRLHYSELEEIERVRVVGPIRVHQDTKEVSSQEEEVYAVLGPSGGRTRLKKIVVGRASSSAEFSFSRSSLESQYYRAEEMELCFNFPGACLFGPRGVTIADETNYFCTLNPEDNEDERTYDASRPRRETFWSRFNPPYDNGAESLIEELKSTLGKCGEVGVRALDVFDSEATSSLPFQVARKKAGEPLHGESSPRQIAILLEIDEHNAHVGAKELVLATWRDVEGEEAGGVWRFHLIELYLDAQESTRESGVRLLSPFVWGSVGKLEGLVMRYERWDRHVAVSSRSSRVVQSTVLLDERLELVRHLHERQDDSSYSESYDESEGEQPSAYENLSQCQIVSMSADRASVKVTRTSWEMGGGEREGSKKSTSTKSTTRTIPLGKTPSPLCP